MILIYSGLGKKVMKGLSPGIYYIPGDNLNVSVNLKSCTKGIG